MGTIVREPLGQDRFHPRWGTILEEFVGRAIGKETSTYIRSEIQRLVQNYIVVQTTQIERDQRAGRKSRYRPSEILTGASNIQIQQSYDRINVRVTLETENGETFDVVRSVRI
jgi:hypothetical protein